MTSYGVLHAGLECKYGERYSREGATKWVNGLRNKSYDERLKILNLTTLQKRRKRGDLIETFKIVTGKEDIESKNLFRIAADDHDLRGHQLRIYKQLCRSNVR